MAEQTAPIDAFLGYGILRPFQRDRKNDFANAGGRRLVASAVGQILGTEAQSEVSRGELPWRTTFGSKLHILRHRKGPAQPDLLRAHVQEAIRTWEPRVATTRVVPTFSRAQRLLAGRVGFDLITDNRPGNRVVVPGEDVTVSISG